MTIDIGPLSTVVRRVDASTTIRSFFAVLAPFVVLWNIGQIAWAMGFLFEAGLVEVFFGGEDVILAILSLLVAFVLAFAPVWFVIADWLARRPGPPDFSALSGAALGALGVAILGALVGLFVDRLNSGLGRTYAEIWRCGLVGACVAILLGLWIWMLASPRWPPGRLMPVFKAAAVVLCLGIVAWLLVLDGAIVALALAALLSLATGLARAVWIRMVLATGCPRPLVLGGFHKPGFWIRMAHIAGLPSSLWSARAWREPAFWALLLARPLVYLGVAWPVSRAGFDSSARAWFVGVALIVLGHASFYFGKRLAARAPWKPYDDGDRRAPILFLRSFEDDQLRFWRAPWDLPGRWLDLWSFRRNVDEAMVGELQQYGPVVALGQPGETRAPFGAVRYYATHDDWQSIIVETARRAQAIVIVAGDSPGVRWEFDMLAREQLVERTLLLFRPGRSQLEVNRHAMDAFPRLPLDPPTPALGVAACPVALLRTETGPRLLVAHEPSAASYVVALRAFFNLSMIESYDRDRRFASADRPCEE